MRFRREGYPSGQREQTVNLPALPSKVRILPPPPSESGIRGDGFVDSSYLSRGCSSMVEQKPSKLTTRVRFPSPAPRLGGCRTGEQVEAVKTSIRPQGGIERGRAGARATRHHGQRRDF